jgi:hypothetical protein
MSKSDDEWRELKRRANARRTRVATRATPLVDSTALILGRNERDDVVAFARRARLQHAHVIGVPHSGKSKFLEHCIRQDIDAGLGVCVIDPHGHHPDSLFRSTLSWLGERRLHHPRPVHVLDLNADTHTIGFNPLALPSPRTAISMVVAAALEAIERIWGDEDSHEKPTLRRALKGTLTVLTELGLTLADAPLLLDPDDAQGFRAWARAHVRNSTGQAFLARLDRLARSRNGNDFDQEVIGPQNRLAELLDTPMIRTILGQTQNVLDFEAIFREGHILLVNLGSVEDAPDTAGDMFGRLLVRSLFFHAKRRASPEPPMFLYADECQRYLSGDVPNLLAESRKFGLGAVLAHQYLAQLGKPDDLLRQAVLNVPNFKAVFRLRYPADARELAETVIRLDHEMPVKASIRPTVVGHRRVRMGSESRGSQTTRGTGRARSTGETDARGYSISTIEADTEMTGTTTVELSGTSTGTTFGQMMEPAQGFFTPQPGVANVGPFMPGPVIRNRGLFARPVVLSQNTGEGESESQSTASGTSVVSGHTSAVAETESRIKARSQAESTSEQESFGESHTAGWSEAFEPVYADLPASFHGLDKVTAMAGEFLMGLATGRACVSFVDQHGALKGFLKVPLVNPPPLTDAEFADLRTRFLDASPSAKPAAEAIREVEDRARWLLDAARQTALEARRPPPEPESFREPAPPRKPRKPRP